jgi:diacylglycerol kinase family enzyme
VRRLSVYAEGRKAPCRSPCIFVGNNEYTLTLPAVGTRRRLDAGELWVYVAKSQSRWALFWLACRALLGLIDVGKDLELFRVESAQIRSRTSRLPVAYDGEVEIMHTPLRYRMRPAALRVFAPVPAPT